MEIRRCFDDKEIRRLLAGSEGELAEALTLIDRQLRDRMCGWLHKRCPLMDAETLANTWSEAILCLLQAIRAGRFDPARPLLPWLCQTLHARAVDHARRSRCRQDVLTMLGVALRQRRVQPSGIAASAEERREVVQLIREAIGRLPAQQQLVLQVFVDHYPDSASMERLREEVGRASGRTETLASVKRALQEARVKVRAFLRRKGYSLGDSCRN